MLPRTVPVGNFHGGNRSAERGWGPSGTQAARANSVPVSRAVQATLAVPGTPQKAVDGPQ